MVNSDKTEIDGKEKDFSNSNDCRQRKLGGKIDLRLIRVNRIIRNEYEKPHTLESLAEIIKCNPVYLSNMYSKVFKCPPIKHLQKVRIKKAQILLAETSISIFEVTRFVGYISNSQFSDYFKKHTGLTPSSYRKKFTFREGEIKLCQ